MSDEEFGDMAINLELEYGRLYTVLYCNVLYSTVLYCTVLYRTIMYRTVPYDRCT